MRWVMIWGLLGLAPEASAAGWSDFVGLFATSPCADGWSACGGVDAEPARDASGVPIPTDQRVAWFDLAPTRAFDPFVAWEAHVPPPRPAPAPAPPPAPVERPPPPAVELVAPEVEEVPVGAAPEPVEVAVELEVAALRGALPEVERTRLETIAAGSGKPTERDDASRVLMVDAWARGDQAAFLALARRHLLEIDQSDADLVYRYALLVGRMEPERWRDVAHWSAVALENRHIWTGDTYQQRVSGLYKLRCGALQSGWARAEVSDVDALRAETKVCAREWLEFERLAGRDEAKALQLCTSAAGTADYCR